MSHPPRLVPKAHAVRGKDRGTSSRSSLSGNGKSDRRKELLAFLKEGPDGIAKWNILEVEVRGLAPFRNVNCSGLELSGARLPDMPKACFDNASLMRADLSGCDFSRAQFKKSSLREGRLVGTKLHRANFESANLTDSDLRDANLEGALLQGAILTGALLQGASFKRARIDSSTVWPKDFPIPADAEWDGQGPHPAQLEAISTRKALEGPVGFAGFMERLERLIEKARLAKAMAMLRSERFQLFVESSEVRLAGIVKSQNDPTLVYSCALSADGSFGCCTQNLNVCGGLRGSLCKHLLVLIVGHSQAADIAPDTLDVWVQRSALHRPVLDRDALSALLLRYKGAESGEIDWRPTETIPEDFYAFQ